MDLPRQTALDLLETVLDKKRSLDEAFPRAVDVLNDRDSAFVRQLVATCLRRLGQIDHLIDGCLKKPLPPKMTAPRNILRLGVAQLLFMNTAAHAAIDTAVNLADSQSDKRVQGFKGVINAVLRRLSKEGASRRSRQDSARLNTPKWLWDSWAKAYDGKTARGLAEAHLREAPLDLTLKAGEDPESWAKALGGIALPTGSVRVADAGRVEALPGYREGTWWVQDAAAALPGKLLGDISGLKVADLCAAPGGKTAQLASMGADVIAVDRSGGRLKRLKQNLKRLKLEAEIVQADAAQWQPDAPVDAVLVDAPCSATGTIRRHPDVLHLKTPRDIKTLGPAQTAILENASKMVKPGGVLVYCVCSLQPEEGPRQIDAFLKAHSDFAREPVVATELAGLEALIDQRGDLRTLPLHLQEQGGLDGFYAARLRKLG
ncbi:MAG: RsmB/NOP family class I SAM-dependent RNA methyltransferase [Alphaproteobacteria bacterium]